MDALRLWLAPGPRSASESSDRFVLELSGCLAGSESGEESSGVSRPGMGKNVDGGMAVISGSGLMASNERESRKAAVLGVRASMVTEG